MAAVEPGAIVEQRAIGRVVDAETVRSIVSCKIVHKHVTVAFNRVTSESAIEGNVASELKEASCNPETVNVVQVSSVRIKRSSISLDQTIAIAPIPMGVIALQHNLIAQDPHTIVVAKTNF